MAGYVGDLRMMHCVPVRFVKAPDGLAAALHGQGPWLVPITGHGRGGAARQHLPDGVAGGGTHASGRR